MTEGSRVVCPHCAASISTQATTCPHCDAAIRSARFWARLRLLSVGSRRAHNIREPLQKAIILAVVLTVLAVIIGTMLS